MIFFWGGGVSFFPLPLPLGNGREMAWHRTVIRQITTTNHCCYNYLGLDYSRHVYVYSLLFLSRYSAPVVDNAVGCLKMVRGSAKTRGEITLSS